MFPQVVNPAALSAGFFGYKHRFESTRKYTPQNPMTKSEEFFTTPYWGVTVFLVDGAGLTA
ncbi:hypothetical protein [Geobacter metallireducens]|uniref:hypothetical protein n=1 Tax=Geobacter metallireducens TaxID=28232 RepID=UPI001110B7D1|nr:hypothetical protein [Geobacter metallireducens]